MGYAQLQPRCREHAVAVELLLVVLVVLGLLFISGLIVLVVWLARRTQAPTQLTEATETPAPPQ